MDKYLIENLMGSWW